MITNDDDFITTSEACDILQVSKTIVKRMADSGELETWKTPGGHRRIKRDSIAKVLKQQSSPKSTETDTPLKVMVLDHDSAIQALFANFFKKDAFLPVDIVPVLNGYEGLVKAGQMFFDMIFVDLNMPLMDGFEAVRVLREYENIKSTTIIVITCDILTDQDRSKLPPDVIVMNKPLNFEVIKQFMQYEYALKKRSK